MRRTNPAHFLLQVCALMLAAVPAPAQQDPINPRLPPPPPPPELPTPAPAPKPELSPQPSAAADKAAAKIAPADIAVPPSLPETVVIPSGTRIAVVLDTPLSTRIARQGQTVTFRTSDALRLGSQIELPPETPFTGTVVEAKRPGRFGKPGVLRVKVERIHLPTGITREVAARLDSPDLNASGRSSSDNNRATDLYNLALYTLQGTLIGGQIKGGKGAAVGAGAGATVALLIMMSRRGPDLYLEPGMPFLITLDQNVALPGKEVYAAQHSYARSHTSSRNAGSGMSGQASDTDSDDADPNASEIRRNPDEASLDPDRPKLKRRPKNPQP